MSLCERPFSPFSFLFGSGSGSNRPSTHPSSSTASTSSALIGDFEDTLRHRLLSLLPPVPERAVPLAYLSRAVGVLASTHAEATRMLRNVDPTSGHAVLVSAYLDTSSRILAFCNALSAEVDGLRRRRLLLAYALQLLVDGGAGGGKSGAWRIEKAKKAIVEWEEEEVEGGPKPAYNLYLPKAAVLPEVHSLGGSDKCARGRRLAPVERAVFAVEAVFALVRGILLRFLRPDETKSAATTSAGIHGVPDGLGWASVYKELRTAFFSASSDRGPPAWVHEINAVKSRAKELTCAPNNTIVGVAAGIGELKNNVEDLTRGLEGLDEAVTGLFRSTLRARDAALESLRAGRTKCK